ncbi:hypothetical protein GCM10028807_28220 [Spirosoma daeguense]
MSNSDYTIDLVKVYLKTLCGRLAVLPQTIARPWGYEFSLEEYEAIYLGLQTLLLSTPTNTIINEQLWIEFEKLSQNRQAMHWFMYQYVEQLVAIIHDREAKLQPSFWVNSSHYNLN